MTRCVTFFSFLYKTYWSGAEEKEQSLLKATEVCQNALEQVRKNKALAQENTLDGFRLLDLPPELLFKISAYNPAVFFGVNRELQAVFLDEMNQHNWFANLSLLERLWPELPPELSTMEKNRAILQEIRTLFTPAEFEEILGRPRFCGSAEEIHSINRACKEREDFATVALYTAIGKRVENLASLTGSLAQQAAAATLWLENNQTVLDTITSLELNGKALMVIPKGIEKCRNLLSLDLCSNNIARFPKDFVWPSGLEKLWLTGNQLGPFLERVKFPATLRYLCLGSNQIVSVSKNLRELPVLISLDISYNQITNLAQTVRGFAKLAELDLRDNQIEFVPHKVSWPLRLRILKLAGNNISTLSYKIRWPVSLEVLDLGRNQIERISSRMRWPLQLRTLAFDKNKLTDFPESLVRLLELRTLYLSENQIGALPEKQMQWPAELSTIWLHDNDIPSLPVGWKRPGLMILWQDFRIHPIRLWPLW